MLTLISIIILSVLVVLVVVLRYGFLYPSKCDHRKDAFYKEGYMENLFKQKKEVGFTVEKVLNKSNATNIISYCIYGTNPKYYRNIVKNIKIADAEMSDWKVRVYVHNKVQQNFINELVKNGAEVYIVDDIICKPGNGAGTFWRFLPLLEKANVIILDADDKLTSKEIQEIKYFFNNDHNVILGSSTSPFPKSHLMACKLYKKKEFQVPWNEDFIKRYPIRSLWGSDEIFLSFEVYPYAKKQGLTRKKWFFDFLLRNNEPKSLYPMFLKYHSK